MQNAHSIFLVPSNDANIEPSSIQVDSKLAPFILKGYRGTLGKYQKNIFFRKFVEDINN